MGRGPAVVMAFVVAGGLGTAFMGRWDAFAVGFSFLFWGGMAAAITLIAGGREKPHQANVLPNQNPDMEQAIARTEFNPATGLLIGGNDYGVDVGGNTYGTTDATR